MKDELGGKFITYNAATLTLIWMNILGVRFEVAWVEKSPHVPCLKLVRIMLET